MAIYRLSADIVRRSAGRTGTAAAAYRSGALIVDARTGLAFDYTRRRGVQHAEIIAPESAPAWMRDRARLWNGVEAAERRKDAQLARDIELALPHELAPAERRELVRGFVLAAFVSAGMVADVALHAPGEHGDHRNHHAHIMLTMRRIEGDGFGAKERAWNDAAMLETWRALWAEHVNQALDLAGQSARVDHRSLEVQGIERVPGIHLGPAVSDMQRRGAATERAELAQTVVAINAVLASPVAGAETREAPAAVVLHRQPLRALTARQRTRSRALTLFRRLGRALMVRALSYVSPGVPYRPQRIAQIVEARCTAMIPSDTQYSARGRRQKLEVGGSKLGADKPRRLACPDFAAAGQAVCCTTTPARQGLPPVASRLLETTTARQFPAEPRYP